MKGVFISIFAVFFLILCSGCSSHPAVRMFSEKSAPLASTLSQEEAGEVLSGVGGSWFYGHGSGETAFKVATILAFPPSAIFFLGRTTLSLAGVEIPTISGALPEPASSGWTKGYDSLTSIPGRIFSAVSRKRFYEREEVEAFYSQYLSPPEEFEPWLLSDLPYGQELKRPFVLEKK